MEYSDPALRGSLTQKHLSTRVGTSLPFSHRSRYSLLRNHDDSKYYGVIIKCLFLQFKLDEGEWKRSSKATRAEVQKDQQLVRITWGLIASSNYDSVAAKTSEHSNARTLANGNPPALSICHVSRAGWAMFQRLNEFFLPLLLLRMFLFHAE